MSNPEILTLEGVLRVVAEKQLNAFNSEAADLQTRADLYAGAHVLDKGKLKKLADDIQKCLEKGRELEKAAKAGSADDEARLYVRQIVKYMLFNVLDDAYQYDNKLTGNPDTISMADMGLYRFVEARLALEAEIQAAKDAKDATEEARHWDAARTIYAGMDAFPATYLIEDFKDYYVDLPKKEKELTRTEPAEIDLNDDELTIIKDLAQKKLNAFNTRSLTVLRRKVAAYAGSPAQDVPPEVIDGLKAVKTGLEKHTANSEALGSDEIVLVNSGTTGRKNKKMKVDRAKEIAAVAGEIVANAEKAAAEENEDLKAYQNAILNYTRIGDQTLGEFLHSLSSLPQPYDEPTKDKVRLAKQRLEAARDAIGRGYYSYDPATIGYFNSLHTKEKEWINTVVAPLDSVLGTPGTTPTSPENSTDLTHENIMNPRTELDKWPSDKLYKAAKVLQGQYFSELQATKSQQKADINKRYRRIQEILGSRGVENGINWADRATYLDDIKELYDVVAIPVKSAMTVDMKTMLEGGGDWYGAKTASQFNEGHLIRLLYGVNLQHTLDANGKVEPTFDSLDTEERERLKIQNETLKIVCNLYSEVKSRDLSGRVTKKGDFHATQQFNDALKGRFKAEIMRKLKVDVLHIGENDPLTPIQEEAFRNAWWLQQALDLRTYYALAFYEGGWSPEDDIGATIGYTAELVDNGKIIYVIVGKSKFMVDVSGAVSLPSEEVWNTIDSPSKRNNFKFATEIATPLWLGWVAPFIDEEEGITEKEKVVFRRQGLQTLVPGLWDFYHDTPTRQHLMQAASPVLQTKNETKDRKMINLLGLLQGQKASKEFREACEDGFTPSGDMHKDIDAIKEHMVTLAEKISPTKSLMTMNGRALGNSLYQYARTSLLSFGEKYHNEPEYHRYFARFLNQIRSSISSFPTAEIPIDPKLLPPEFRKRFGLKPAPAVIKIKDYVLALLPQAAELSGPSQSRYFVENDRKVNGKTARVIMDSVQYHPRRVENNKLGLEHAREEKEGYIHSWKQAWQARWRGGSHSHELHPHFHIEEDPTDPTKERRTLKDFFTAMTLPALTSKEKRAKDDKDK